MSQDRRSLSFPIKSILLTFFISLLSLVAFLALASRVLMSFDHFERYYEAACFIVYAAEGVFLAIVARRFPGNAVLFTLCVAVLVALTVIVTGLIFGQGIVDLSRLGLRLSVYAGIPAFALLIPLRKERRPAKKFKR